MAGSKPVYIKDLSRLAIEAICKSLCHYGWRAELTGLLPASLVQEIKLTFKNEFYFVCGGFTTVSPCGSRLCIPCCHDLMYSESDTNYAFTCFESRPLHFRSVLKADFCDFCKYNLCTRCCSPLYDILQLFCFR